MKYAFEAPIALPAITRRKFEKESEYLRANCALRMNNKMRIYHRYLGFFLSGIMAMYAISGIILIFRNTDFLKNEKVNEVTLDANLPDEEIGKSAPHPRI